MFFRQHPASVMVWGGVTDCGKKTPLIVIPAGVKVNSDIYIDLLNKKVLPWIKKQDWANGYCFMQDGAPAHTSNKTQAYLRENFDEFWSKEKWPPSSPDANPMDFSVQSILETKVCKKNYSSVKLLTKSLQQEWKKISVDEIRKICAAAPNRLKAIAEKEGHHVE